MKLRGFLMLAAAGLSFAACQKNVDVNKVKEGTAAVSVKIVDNAYTKAMTGNGTTDTKLSWDKAMVKLTAQSGISSQEVAPKTEAKFMDIQNPQSLEVVINGGKETYTNLTEFNALTAAKMHAYAKVSNFGEATPGTKEENLEGYQVYRVTADTKIPAARVEVKGIKVVAPTDGSEQAFSALTLSHVYMDAAPSTDVNVVYPYENKVTATTAAETWNDFVAKDVLSVNVEGGNVITGGAIQDLTFPADDNVYAFNIFGQGTGVGNTIKENKMPILTFHFTGAALKNGTCNPDQYAVVKAYKKNGTDEYITSFEAGVIYTINSVEIQTKSLIPDPTDDNKYAVVANVTVQDWTIVDTTVEF